MGKRHTITIEFTRGEGRALREAMSNMLDATDYREQLDFFGSAQAVKAAWRAYEKVKDSYWGTWKWRKRGDT